MYSKSVLLWFVLTSVFCAHCRPQAQEPTPLTDKEKQDLLNNPRFGVYFQQLLQLLGAQGQSQITSETQETSSQNSQSSSALSISSSSSSVGNQVQLDVPEAVVSQPQIPIALPQAVTQQQDSGISQSSLQSSAFQESSTQAASLASSTSSLLDGQFQSSVPQVTPVQPTVGLQVPPIRPTPAPVPQQPIQNVPVTFTPNVNLQMPAVPVTPPQPTEQPNYGRFVRVPLPNTQLPIVPVPNHDDAEARAKAKYHFSYLIDNNIDGSYQEKEEIRGGGLTRGAYTYDDGNMFRTVAYEADADGFRVIKDEIQPSIKARSNLNGQVLVKTMMDGDKREYSYDINDLPHVRTLPTQQNL